VGADWLPLGAGAPDAALKLGPVVALAAGPADGL
jgi:hypothetical protein